MVQFDFTEQVFESNKIRESDILSVGTDVNSGTGTRGQVVTGIKDSKGRDTVAVRCDDKWKHVTLRSSQEIKSLEDRLLALEKKMAIIKAGTDRDLRTTVKMDIFTQTSSGALLLQGLISYMWNNGSSHTNTPYTTPSYFTEDDYVCGIVSWMPTQGTFANAWNNVHDTQYDGTAGGAERGSGLIVAFDTYTNLYSPSTTYDNYIGVWTTKNPAMHLSWQSGRPIRGIFITKK